MITIAPYDPLWPALFEAEARKIREGLGALALRVDHVGSTAVPGLAAKPVIDIQVSVASLEPLESYSLPLSSLGYRHVPLGEFDRVYPYFCKPETWPHTHHVHLCVLGSVEERNHLAFRDYLRHQPDVAAEYVRLKKELAALHHGNTLESQESYSLAKTEFVRSVLQRAFAE